MGTVHIVGPLFLRVHANSAGLCCAFFLLLLSSEDGEKLQHWPSTAKGERWEGVERLGQSKEREVQDSPWNPPSSPFQLES